MLLNTFFIFVIIQYSNCLKNELKPNVIVILTDDQDVLLDGIYPMKSTKKLLANQGVTIFNAFTSSPICCPSRSSILTGMYAHNHATTNNSQTGGCYGDFWKDVIEKKALPVLLKTNGYETFYAGKYLNEYKSQLVPPGWDKWYGLHGNSRYYNYTLNENGISKKYNNEYLTDVLKNISVQFLMERSDETPFFAIVSPPAPHSPFTAATRHENAFQDVNALRTPNFNNPPKFLEKHWLLTMPPATLLEEIINNLDLIYRKRWQSLLAIDELVEQIVTTLKIKNQLENTYIIFTSDNGYHIGQFGQTNDKRQPYETDIRIPMIIRGPNLPRKLVVNFPVALIDLTPTILDWSGLTIPDFIDGRTFKVDLEKVTTNITKRITVRDNFDRQILIEYWGEGNIETYNPDCPWNAEQLLNQCTIDAACKCQDSQNNTYSCIRHLAKNINLIYCEFSDDEHFVEAYDLSSDPYQMTNIGYSMLPSERALYSITLNNMKKCIGRTCRKFP